jgi:hypothetical protein
LIRTSLPPLQGKHYLSDAGPMLKPIPLTGHGLLLNDAAVS